MTKNNAKKFELDEAKGYATYERKDSGYCYRNGVRIRTEQFEAAERDFEARKAAMAEPVEIPGVRKDLNPTATINGHEYVHDWAGRAYYRDGERITRAQFEAETGGEEEAKALTARPRRPKDVAFEADGVTLTAKQLDFLRELAALSEDDLLGNPESGVWCDILCDAIGGQFRGKPMTVGAMLSTICEKGLGERHKEKRSAGTRQRTVTVFCFTEAGLAVFRAVRGGEAA